MSDQIGHKIIVIFAHNSLTDPASCIEFGMAITEKNGENISLKEIYGSLINNGVNQITPRASSLSQITRHTLRHAPDRAAALAATLDHAQETNPVMIVTSGAKICRQLLPEIEEKWPRTPWFDVRRAAGKLKQNTFGSSVDDIYYSCQNYNNRGDHDILAQGSTYYRMDSACASCASVQAMRIARIAEHQFRELKKQRPDINTLKKIVQWCDEPSADVISIQARLVTSMADDTTLAAMSHQQENEDLALFADMELKKRFSAG